MDDTQRKKATSNSSSLSLHFHGFLKGWIKILLKPVITGTSLGSNAHKAIGQKTFHHWIHIHKPLWHGCSWEQFVLLDDTLHKAFCIFISKIRQQLGNLQIYGEYRFSVPEKMAAVSTDCFCLFQHVSFALPPGRCSEKKHVHRAVGSYTGSDWLSEICRWEA